MGFPDRTQPYEGNEVPESGYLRGAKEWDARIGNARAQAYNWRIAAFLFGALALLLAVILGIVASNKQVETYVVPVDNMGQIGEVKLLGNTYQPSKAEIGHFLGEFIKKIRSKSIDPVVMRKNWTEAYNYISVEAKAVLDEYAKETNPLSDIGKEARSVEIRNIVQRSDDTFQIAWYEKQFVKGQLIGMRYYTGVFTVTTEKPKTAAQIYENPLGIKITSMTWDQELVNAE
ncbi:MAG: conjugal transfer protein TrbF [Alphaproteobacteria bacterium]